MERMHEEAGLSLTEVVDSPFLVNACYWIVVNINAITHQNAEMLDLVGNFR